jgi:cytoskeleton protein RodZ
MGTAQFGEDPKTMTKVSMLPTDDRSEARRRLHLRDITNDLPSEADGVGSDLRAARLRRGEDLRTIAQSLRIRREQLEALEESRHDDLPGRAYAIGFVRSYAEFLGLDSSHIVERYKAEIDRVDEAREELPFPKIAEETRLPRGTFLIVGLIVAVGIYGAYLLTRSADRMMAERVPPVPDRIEARVTGSGEAPDERPASMASLSGDPASAATRSAATPAVGLGKSTGSVYAVPPVTVATVTPAEPASEAPAAAPVAAPAVEAAPAVAAAPALPPIPEGQVYGAENTDGHVTIRARKNDAWIRVEDAQGHVLIEQTLKAGDSYKVPGKPGTILVARDASAFELLIDGQSLGLAGPPTLVLTGKSLDPSDLVAALPRPALPSGIIGDASSVSAQPVTPAPQAVAPAQSAAPAAVH